MNRKIRRVLKTVEVVLAAGLLVRILHHIVNLFYLAATRQTKIDNFLFGVALPYLLLRFIFASIKERGENKIELNLDNRRQWLFSFIIVMSLTIGSSLMFHLDKITLVIFTKFSDNPLIDAKEGGILTALEMGIIPIFAIIAFAMIDKWTLKQTFSICWKVFIIGIILGVLIGSTYSLHYQSLSCGILH